MADSDFRIHFSWRTHWKRKLIKRRLGAAGVLAVEDLWAFAAESRQTGDLGDMTDAAIEGAADWEGDEGALICAMCEARLLDGESGAYVLHDWAINQPWIADAPKRSAKAAHAASKRKANRETSTRHLRDNSETPPYLSLPNLTDPENNPPTPVPGESVGDAAVQDSKTKPRKPRKPIALTPTADERAVFDHWQAVCCKSPAIFDDKRIKAVRDRLAEGHSVATLCDAVDGCKVTPWNRGDNPSGKPYLELTLICRDTPRVEDFARTKREGLKPATTGRPIRDVNQGIVRASEPLVINYTPEPRRADDAF